MAGSIVDGLLIFHWLQLLDSLWEHPSSKWCLDSLSLRSIFIPMQSEYEVLSKSQPFIQTSVYFDVLFYHRSKTLHKNSRDSRNQTFWISLSPFPSISKAVLLNGKATSYSLAPTPFLFVHVHCWLPCLLLCQVGWWAWVLKCLEPRE